MARWQRPLRIALLLFAVVFAIGVWSAIRSRPPSRNSGTSPRTDPKAIAESTGGVTLAAKGTKQDYTLRYGRALTYEDGAVRFEDVQVDVPQRAGRDFRLFAKTARVTNNESTVAVEGNVRLVASDGLTVNSASATYDSGEGIVRIPGDVTFARQRMTGRGTGATYDRTRDVIWLLDKAHITMKADPKTNAGAADITSGAAGFARKERYIRFEREMRIVREGQVLQADDGMCYLAADEDRLEMVELRGNARVVPSTKGEGGLQSMSSRDMNLDYADDGQTLERATLAGGSGIQFAAAGPQQGRRLSADWMDVLLAPNGSTVTGLTARDGVELLLPGDGPVPARRIRSTSLEASGPADQGITSARFVDRVQFKEARAATKTAPALEREALSRTLETVVKPGFSAIDAAAFGGGVQFREGAMDATAPDANYDVAKGRLQLVSGAGPGTAGARVDDERATIQARKIDLALDGRSMLAEADVRSLLKGGNPPSAGADSRATKRPGMLQAEQPVNVTSKRLEYDSGAGRATYTGEARLWQGETAVQAETIALDDAKGDLAAKGSVKSTLRLDDTDETTGKKEPKTSVFTADDLAYTDAQRLATYTGSARMNGPEGDLKADKIELYLDEGGHALERVEAYTTVSLRANSRNTTGARMTYFAADGRYVMSGTPVRVLEQRAQECRETIGKTLTFFRSADSITVENEETRTQATTGGKCPGPPAP